MRIKNMDKQNEEKKGNKNQEKKKKTNKLCGGLDETSFLIIFIMIFGRDLI
jgi:hypothetical protein